MVYLTVLRSAIRWPNGDPRMRDPLVRHNRILWVTNRRLLWLGRIPADPPPVGER